MAGTSVLLLDYQGFRTELAELNTDIRNGSTERIIQVAKSRIPDIRVHLGTAMTDILDTWYGWNTWPAPLANHVYLIGEALSIILLNHVECADCVGGSFELLPVLARATTMNLADQVRLSRGLHTAALVREDLISEPLDDYHPVLPGQLGSEGYWWHIKPAYAMEAGWWDVESADWVANTLAGWLNNGDEMLLASEELDDLLSRRRPLRVNNPIKLRILLGNILSLFETAAEAKLGVLRVLS